MNKFVYVFLLFLIIGITATAVDKVATGDPVKPGQIKLSGTIVQTNGDVVFPMNVFITNGSVIANITNISFANITGVTNFQGSTNLIAPYLVQGISNSVGVADANKLIKTDPNGKLDNSFLNLNSLMVTSSTTYLPADVASATNYTTVLTVTNTVISGTRLISGQLFFSDDDPNVSADVIMGRLLEVSINLATTNVISSGGHSTTASGKFDSQTVFSPVGRAALATNIYIMQGMDTAGATGAKFRNVGTSLKVPNPAFSNATYITIMNIP